jgi:hypothetical protein
MTAAGSHGRLSNELIRFPLLQLLSLQEISFNITMKITPFFIALVIGLCIAVPTAVYYLAMYNHDGKGITGILALIIAFFLAIVLAGERLLIKINLIPYNSLCKLEGIALAALAGGYLLMVFQGS